MKKSSSILLLLLMILSLFSGCGKQKEPVSCEQVIAAYE